jgi:hypothetical protein
MEVQTPAMGDNQQHLENVRVPAGLRRLEQAPSTASFVTIKPKTQKHHEKSNAAKSNTS